MVGLVDLDAVDPVQVGTGEQDGTPLLGITLAGDEIASRPSSSGHGSRG